MSSVLATAGFFDVQPDQHFMVQSDWRDGILYTHVRNGDLGNRTRRTFVLRWSPGTWSQVRLIRQHFTNNAHKAITLDLPGGGTAQAIYKGSPQFSRRTARGAEIQVVLEEALITD